jgi:hypothetical protein
MKKGDLTSKLYDELKKRNLFEEEDDNDELENEDKSENEGGSENKDFSNMVSILLHSQTQVHVFHLQTKSYSEHKALQNYYEGIDGLVDGIIESYQGKYDVVKNYETMDIEDYSSVDQLISYFKELDKMVEEKRKSVKESYLQNQIDTIQELIFSTLYRLRFLK